MLQQSIFLMIMRRMRVPLILLIIIISVSVLGLTLATGPVVNGVEQRLSFFEAFYFISFTATTIGFGEIPYEFTYQQRMWVLFCIYGSAIGWAYSLGSVFKLLSDRNLQHAIALVRFERAVRRLTDPFYLICGFGETGRLICNGLDGRGKRIVVLERDEINAGDVDLVGFTADAPTLAADASNPDTLKYAGITHPACQGVLAVTNDESTNLAVAIAAKLLAPRLRVIASAQTREVAANMASFGTTHIIHPFRKFTDKLSLALHSPNAWHLLDWLTSLPGTEVKRLREPRCGLWIICGYGRLARLLIGVMDTNNVDLVIIDPEPPEDIGHRWIQGDASNRTLLEQAGINTAMGLVACTRNDVTNLSIAVSAREMKRSLFIITHQNHFASHTLFDAFDSDITVVASELVASECLAILSTPLLAEFVADVKKRDDEEWCAWLLERMMQRLGATAPELWSTRINFSRAPALYRRVMHGETITLDQLLRSHTNRYEYLACEALYLARDDDDNLIVPAAATPIRPGDEILLAGRPGAQDNFDFNISNDRTLEYLITGYDHRKSWFWDTVIHRHKTVKKRR